MDSKREMQNGELYDCDFDALDGELRKSYGNVRIFSMTLTTSAPLS